VWALDSIVNGPDIAHMKQGKEEDSSPHPPDSSYQVFQDGNGQTLTQQVCKQMKNNGTLIC
jgi:hypothetical protein